MTIEAPVQIHADIEIQAGNAIPVTTTQMPLIESPVKMDVSDGEPYTDPELVNLAPLDRSRAFVGWLIVCFSVSSKERNSKLQLLTAKLRLDQPVA